MPYMWCKCKIDAVQGTEIQLVGRGRGPWERTSCWPIIRAWLGPLLIRFKSSTIPFVFDHSRLTFHLSPRSIRRPALDSSPVVNVEDGPVLLSRVQIRSHDFVASLLRGSISRPHSPSHLPTQVCLFLQAAFFVEYSPCAVDPPSSPK